MIPWLRLLPPTSTFLLTALEGTLQGPQDWDPPDGDKEASRGAAKPQPRLLKGVVKGVGMAWQVDIC